MSDIDPTNPDAVERFLGDAVVCTAGLPMAMAGVIRALQRQVRTLEGRADDAKASADHRALVIGDLTRKLEAEKSRRILVHTALERLVRLYENEYDPEVVTFRPEWLGEALRTHDEVVEVSDCLLCDNTGTAKESGTGKQIECPARDALWHRRTP